ncbi:MAG: hypothetical protein K2P78_02565 [Gemmataceae bacterium]|nr:hypothetical protein [Gemmataceae bacterium]
MRSVVRGVAVLALAAVIGCSGSSGTGGGNAGGSPGGKSAAEAREFSVQELATEFLKDPVASQKKYKDTPLVLKGQVRVTNVGPVGCVGFKVAQRDQIQVFGFFKENDWRVMNEALKAKLLNSRTGEETVAVSFRCAGCSGGRDLVHLNKCELITAEQ